MRSRRFTIAAIALVVIGFVGFWIYDINTSKTPPLGDNNQQQEDDVVANPGDDIVEPGGDNEGDNQGEEPDEGNTTGNNQELVKVGIFPGDQAPEVSLNDLLGNKHSLADYRGKIVVLNFWASWCPPCRDEMPELQSFHEKYRDSDVVLLTINIGEELQERDLEKKIQKDKEIINSYFAEEGFDMTVLLDTWQDVSLSYRINAIPTTYVIDKDGIISSFYIRPLTLEDLEEAIQGLR